MHLRLSAAFLLPFILARPSSSAVAQASGAASIDQPADGAILRGSVQITGTAYSPNFAVADLSFAYSGDTTDTWFTLVEIDRPVVNSIMAMWDTASISDGDYIVRLRVHSQDGTQQEATRRIQIRNYTAPDVPTPTITVTASPLPAVPTALILPIATLATPTQPAEATATPLPPNPAAVSESGVYDVFARGALIAAALGLILGVAILRRRN
jgi:hypothetical protein